MEWLPILALGIVGVESPPPVIYGDQKTCVVAAKRIAAENKWLHYMEVGPETKKVEPGVFRSTVYCRPAKWAKKSRDSK